MDSASILSQKLLHIRLWQEDGEYIAACLDIPGCVGQGHTRDEALANVSDAITSCLDVLREDGWVPNNSPVEIIERPIDDFVRVPVR